MDLLCWALPFWSHPCRQTLECRRRDRNNRWQNFHWCVANLLKRKHAGSLVAADRKNVAFCSSRRRQRPLRDETVEEHRSITFAALIATRSQKSLWAIALVMPIRRSLWQDDQRKREWRIAGILRYWMRHHGLQYLQTSSPQFPDSANSSCSSSSERTIGDRRLPSTSPSQKNCPILHQTAQKKKLTRNLSLP